MTIDDFIEQLEKAYRVNAGVIIEKEAIPHLEELLTELKELRTFQQDKLEEELEEDYDEIRKLQLDDSTTDCEDCKARIRNEVVEELLKSICIGCAYLNGTKCENKLGCPCAISQAEVLKQANKVLNN